VLPSQCDATDPVLNAAYCMLRQDTGEPNQWPNEVTGVVGNIEVDPAETCFSQPTEGSVLGFTLTEGDGTVWQLAFRDMTDVLLQDGEQLTAVSSDSGGGFPAASDVLGYLRDEQGRVRALWSASVGFERENLRARVGDAPCQQWARDVLWGRNLSLDIRADAVTITVPTNTVARVGDYQGYNRYAEDVLDLRGDVAGNYDGPWGQSWVVAWYAPLGAR